MASWNYLAQQPANPFASQTGDPALDQMIEEEWARHNQMAAQAPKGGLPAAPVATKASFSQSSPNIVSTSDYDSLVKRLNEKGVNSLRQQEQGLGDLKSQIQMALEHSSPQMDLSPLMALTDSWSGSKLQQGYARPDNDKHQAMIDQLQGGLRSGQNHLAENEINLLKSQLGVEEAKIAREDRLNAQKAATNLAHSQRVDDLADRDAQRLVSELKGSSRDPIGMAKSKIVAAEKIDEMLRKEPDKNNLPPVIMHELAIAMANMLSPGVPAESTIQGLKADTWQGKTAELMQKISGQPVGANQAGFAELMADIVNREKEVSGDQYRREVSRILPAYERLKKHRPDIYNSVLATTGIKPEDLDEKGVYNAKMLKQGETAAAPQITPEQARAELARRRGGK